MKSKEVLSSTEHVKSIAPLDIYLGIDKIPFKMSIGVLLACAYWAQDQCSYEKAQDKIKLVYGICVDNDTIRKAANFVGKAVYERDCKTARETWDIFNNMPLPIADKKKSGIFYMETDGCTLNTRIKDENGSTWRENKLGLFFTSDNIKIHTVCKGEKRFKIENKKYVSYIGSVDEFKKHFLAGALLSGYGQYEKNVLLSDGAAWISNMKEELFGNDVIHILDFFHLCENVYTYAKVKFNMNKELYDPWAKKICEKLKAGQWNDVLSNDLKKDETYLNTVNLYHYIYEHRNQINYPQYLNDGLYIGSGHVESSNKTIVQRRFKQPGMRWGVETAQYMVSLISKVESGQWQSDVVNLLYKLLEG